jgi:putative DNA primase/helicase
VTRMIDFAKLNNDLLSRARSLVESWLPEGKREADEWSARNPTRADHDLGSFKVNTRSGAWSDFATGDKGGDLISLYAYLHDMGQAEAARKLIAELGLSMNGNGRHSAGKDTKSNTKSPGRKSDYVIVWPISPTMLTAENTPSNLPPLPRDLRGKVATGADLYPYLSADGHVLCFVARFKRHDGKKEIRPLNLWRHKSDHTLRWQWKFPPGERPIYGLDVLRAKPNARALSVEGEAKCDAAREMLPDHAVISWMGGAKAVHLTKWDALITRQTPIVLWPDNDGAGATAMMKLGGIVGAERVRVIVPQPDWPVGFDVADLIAAEATREQLEEIIGGAVPLSEFEAIAAARWPDARAKGRSTPPDESAEPEPPTPYSEIALSNRFTGEGGADFHYTKGSWWCYDEAGGLWANDETLRIFTEVKRFSTRMAREICDAAPGEDENAQKAARRFASELTAAKKVAAVEGLTRSHPAIVTTLDQFDRDIWTLNTPGGVVHLRDGTVRPTRRDDFFTKSTLVPPRDMPTPIFDRFIREIMGAHVPPAICKCASCAASVGKIDVERQVMHDAEVQRLAEYSLRLYGYCLSGDVSDHILVMLVGDGGNGKTLLTDFISRDIFGLAPIGYSVSLPIEALLANKNDRHPTELMSLFHTRLALASEPSSGVSWNEGLVMRLTGGEPVTARGMRQDFITFPGTHKLFVVGNTAPTLRGGREPAWQRRLHMIPFQQRWADRADDLNNVRLADASLREKLRPEAPGVLHKLVLGCVEYVRRGSLNPPDTIRQTSNNYLKQQNVIGRWLDERCDRTNPGETVTVAELWADLTRWGEAGHEYIGTRNDFNGALERLGIVIVRLGTQRGICRGLNLLSRGDEAS